MKIALRFRRGTSALLAAIVAVGFLLTSPSVRGQTGFAPVGARPPSILLSGGAMMDGNHFAASNLEPMRDHFAGCRRVTLLLHALHPEDRDRMAERLRQAFQHLGGIEVESLHGLADDEARAALRAADGIFVGGGQTFFLLRELHRTGLLRILRERIDAGVPFAGSSAGANIAGPVIGTTNDFPVADVPSIASLGVFPAVINPHHPADPQSAEEASRAYRIREYLKFNPSRRVLALGDRAVVRLHRGQARVEVGPAWLYSGKERTELPEGRIIAELFEAALAGPGPGATGGTFYAVRRSGSPN